MVSSSSTDTGADGTTAASALGSPLAAGLAGSVVVGGGVSRAFMRSRSARRAAPVSGVWSGLAGSMHSVPTISAEGVRRSVTLSSSISCAAPTVDG